MSGERDQTVEPYVDTCHKCGSDEALYDREGSPVYCKDCMAAL